MLLKSLHALFDASLSGFTLIQSSFKHLSLHCRIEDQGDDGDEEDEDVVGGVGHVGQVESYTGVVPFSLGSILGITVVSLVGIGL